MALSLANNDSNVVGTRSPGSLDREPPCTALAVADYGNQRSRVQGAVYAGACRTHTGVLFPAAAAPIFALLLHVFTMHNLGSAASSTGGKGQNRS